MNSSGDAAPFSLSPRMDHIQHQPRDLLTPQGTRLGAPWVFCIAVTGDPALRAEHPIVPAPRSSPPEQKMPKHGFHNGHQT